MISQIIIKNFAIIDKLDIELDMGMTALTGETGAGKSILLNAIQLVLGDRADSDTVKSGCDKAEVIVSFIVNEKSSALIWLRHNDLDDEQDLIIRRTINSNGRSKAYINGTPAPLAQLKALGSLLVDLHGQHEHQSLQNSDVQMALLDSSLDKQSLLKDVSFAYKSWQHIKKQLKDMVAGLADKQQRIDLLTLYTQEFNELALKDNELVSLEIEHKKLSNADELIRGSHDIAQLLFESEEHSIQNQLNICLSKIEQLSGMDESLKETAGLLNTAAIQVQEAVSEISQYQDSIEHNTERLNCLDQRIASCYQLASKHHISTDELCILAEKLNLELESLTHSDHDSDAHQALEIKLKAQFVDLAKTLNKKRLKAAASLSNNITQAMQELSMQGGQFHIKVEAVTSEKSYSIAGMDNVLFEISANPGQSLKPLTRVASGGELSRMSLAIQVILSQSSDIETMIFDEVDSGIGGGVAEIVGQKLRLIAHNRQVLCVTHLAQVAAQAHHHFQVIKSKTGETTTTNITPLAPQKRVDEIARMLGGVNITEQTKAHALEMIQQVKQ